MNPLLRRVGSAMSPVALLVALLALVASAAGVGYAVGQIGTSDIKNNAITAKKIKKNAVTTKKIKKNAVTTKKVKDGSLTAADLVAEEKYHAAALGNGTQGDCVWHSADAEVPGLGLPAFRKDRDGVVHMVGVALVDDGPGGDGVCNLNDPGESSDGIAFTLPAGYIPFKTMIFATSSSGVLIVGPSGINLPGLFFPAGAVVSLSSGDPIILDGVSFEAAGSPAVAKLAANHATGKVDLAHALQALGVN